MGVFASGYTIALPFAPPPSEFFSERVPSLVVTVSECLTELVPDPGLLPRSGVSDVEGTKRMNRAGIALDVVPEMAAAMAAFIDAGDYIFPVFTSLDAALAFKNRFLAALDVRVLGLGVPAELVPSYLERWRSEWERSGDNWYGTLSCLRKGQPLAPGGTDLGYEPVGEEFPGSFHSWLCCGVVPDVHERLGVVMNGFGLVDDQRVAIEAAELIEREEWGEPVPWLPLLLVSY